MIAQEWPCWIMTILALKLLLSAAFISKEFHSVFNTPAYVPLTQFAVLWDVPPDWNSCTVLASGSHNNLSYVLTKLRHHEGPFIYATDIVVKGRQGQDIVRLYETWTALWKDRGLLSSVVSHVDFGGVTSTIHLMSYWGVNQSVFNASPLLPWVLAHILNAAFLDVAHEIKPPHTLDTPRAHSPTMEDGLLHQEGLYDVFHFDLKLACQCVFKSTVWAQ